MTNTANSVKPLGPAEQVKAIEEIQQLKRERNAIILAHNYQIPEIQDLADYVGDSLGLSMQAAQTQADVIVFCGVHFMAETAAVLCPQKTVLIPSLEAGCSLAATINAEQLRQWKAEHPNAVVVSYINTTAEVKAETDYCCTSSNAEKVIRAIPEEKEILFLPDMFLGAYLQRVTGRKMHLWLGECHVHAGIRPDHVKTMRQEHPHAEFLIHPECGCASPFMYHVAEQEIAPTGTHILSTGHMIRHAKQSPTREFIVATEIGILHQLRKQNPDKTFIPAHREAVCQYMKMITLENLRRSLREMIYRVIVPEEIARRARRSIERMLELA
ncbi:MAG: quinolinate synthase NadA [Acidobacteriota bacterium]|nr:quinolinate synthase NadA [Blastocatellia bacterium]MDW8240454.1 quinolinate synthase NadA [Acidobacteriota bacterium]